MHVNVLTEVIEEGVPIVMLAPHLDDAALSCGALMLQAAERTHVTVVTFFTESGRPRHTLSACRYLQQVGAQNAQKLYEERRTEDRAALESVGVPYLHVGLTEALFRRRPNPGWRSLLAPVLPELTHTYPSYRLHITSGRVASADMSTLDYACGVIQRLADTGPSIVLAPLAVGRHVDHVIVRSAAERSGARVVYYSDFPYNQRHQVDSAFILRNQLIRTQWSLRIEAKSELILAYKSQVHALFKGGHIPVVPEVYFVPGDPHCAATRPVTVAGGDLARKDST
jgi:LmbE family N-acetylglucosaminyl deacetylase